MTTSSSKQYISLVEAYMSGTFSKVDDNTLRYPDYMDNTILYTESIENINKILKSAYGNTTHMIQGWCPLDIQFALHNQSKEPKIASLENLDDYGKAQLQNIRLYDFIKGLNMVLPDEASELFKNCQSEEEYKGILNSDYCKTLDTEAEVIKKNRLAVGTAMKLLNVDDLLDAYKNPLYFTGTSFTSINAHIAKSIASIQKDEMEDLIDNQSRAESQCCIC